MPPLLLIGDLSYDVRPMTLTALGEQLVCESGTNRSRLIERLVASGHVNRTTDVADRRRIELALTALGSAAEARVRQVEARFYAEVDTVIPAEEVENLLRTLEPIVAGQPTGIALARRMAGAARRPVPDGPPFRNDGELD